MHHSPRLSFLDNYQCLADKCPDNCCHRWNINVDSETLQQWQTIEDKERRDFILKSIFEVKKKDNTEFHILKHDDGNCIHSDKNGLCCIQRDFGHDYLPITCQQYPKTSFIRHDIKLESAHISCPAIIELLANTKINQLIKEESMLYDKMDTSLINQISIELHNYTNRLFSNPTTSNGLKLYLISQLLNDVMKMAATESLTLDSLQNCCQNAANSLDKDLTNRHPDYIDSAKNEINQFLEILHTGLISKYQEILNKKFNIRLEKTNLDEFKALGTSPSFLANGKLLTNYLYLKFINNGFPWNPVKNSHAASFLDSAFPFIICHILVLTHIKSNIEISSEILQKIIYSVEKLNAHNYNNFELIGNNQQLLNFNKYNKFFSLLP